MLNIYLEISFKHILNSTEYTITRNLYFWFHALKSCLDSATGGLYVTVTSQVVAYAPAERAETFSLFPVSPSPLCDRAQINFEDLTPYLTYRVKGL
jgi:hypothetical protein